MNTAILTPSAPLARPLLAWFAESMARQRVLTVYALLLLAALLPALVALGLDDRTLRGVSVWIKPIKFLLSTAVFAATTAWFFGLLAEARRQSRTLRGVAWTIVIAGTLEIAYIAVQAALGAPSHYNFSDRLHIALYSAMGAGALAMTSTQLVLSWQIGRHGRADLHPTWRNAVRLGLVLTFALGSAAGLTLSSMQAPAGSGLPLFGWHLGGGDLRPAHFLGLHAQQLLPLAGLALLRLAPRRGQGWLIAIALLYVLAWGLLLARGLDGAVMTVPKFA